MSTLKKFSGIDVSYTCISVTREDVELAGFMIDEVDDTTMAKLAGLIGDSMVEYGNNFQTAVKNGAEQLKN